VFVAHDKGDLAVVVPLGMVIVDVTLVIFDLISEKGGFDTAETTQAPTGNGYLQDLLRFGLRAGAVVGLVAVEIGFEFLRVIAGEAPGLGGQAVLEAIEADGSVSFFGTGAGTLLSVAAVCFDLFV